MSEKNLTELEWKKFSKGKGYKDAAFVKALAALETGKTPEARLAALDDIEKQADVLRKAAKADKELASYLDDAGKAAAKERKLQEAEAKKARQSASGDDEEDSPALLTTKMIPLMRLVPKGETLHAMVALTGKEVAVLVSKKPIGPPRRKLLTDYLGVSGGVKYAVGEVIWEAKAHTFVLQTQAAGLAKKIKTALQKQTEQRFKVRVRGEDPNDIDDDGEDAAELEQAEAEGSEATMASQEPAVDPSTAFNARLAALMPRVKEASAAGGAGSDALKQKVGEAGQLARDKQFDPAHARLDEVEALLQRKPQAPGGEDASAAFNARLAALVPRVKEAVAAGWGGDVKLKISEAGVLAHKKDFAGGHALLDEVERLLAGGASVPGDFAKRWQAARQQWQQASDAVDAQIAQLRAQLRNETDEDLQRIAEFGLNAVTGGHKVPMMAVMRELDAGEATPQAINEARAVVEDFLEHVQTDGRVAACDANPFKVKVSVRGTLGPALQSLAAALTL